MPIGDRPLLEYWLEMLHKARIDRLLVNRHHHAELVREFLERPRFSSWVQSSYEASLLGTAGTLRLNQSFFGGCRVLLIHADNWCQCELEDFIQYHLTLRPFHCLITMMTFECMIPQTCGIVETDDEGVVFQIHEKVASPPSNIANAAVYMLEPEVLEWLGTNDTVTDFSTGVLPQFLGQIATWHNNQIHRDIGSPLMLALAQKDPKPTRYWSNNDSWQEKFLQHPIHQEIAEIAA